MVVEELGIEADLLVEQHIEFQGSNRFPLQAPSFLIIIKEFNKYTSIHSIS